MRAPSTHGTWTDLTMSVSPDMARGTDHPAPEFSEYATVFADGWEGTRLTLSSHTGTHLDAPSHFEDGAATIDEVPLDLLVGQAQVIHLRGLGEGAAIAPEDLGEIRSTRVLVHTGWDAHLGDASAYFERHPYLTDAAGEHLLRHGVRLLGIDTPSVDYDPPSFVHHLILGAGGVIAEGLVNLARIPDRCELIVLPLLLAGVDGSPVRAIARALPDP